jgi:hypothetical protein
MQPSPSLANQRNKEIMKPETIEEARAVLQRSGCLYDRDYSDPEDDTPEQTINLNDTWAWAYACCQEIKDDELIEVAELFRRYGYCGLLYWAANKQDIKRSEFEDITRFIDFVRNEEAIRKEVPDSNKRAYAKREYTLGKKYE